MIGPAAKSLITYRSSLITYLYLRRPMKTPLSYWLFRATSAIRWYLGASTRYDVHSPRLVEFINEVWRDDRHYHAFDLVRSVREYWRRKAGRVKLRSLGAPSKTTSKTERSVSSLVATNAIDDDCGRLLFRLAVWLRARHLIEFGTNAGISTLYLHAADTRATLHTVEGNPDVAALARETFDRAGVGPGLKPYVGLFNDWLFKHAKELRPSTTPTSRETNRPTDQQTNRPTNQRTNRPTDQQSNRPQSPPPLDLFFLDGDHRHQPTLDYVSALMPLRSESAVFVVADIHWSEGMERAWEELKTWPEVTASVDTYHFGLLFFQPGMDGPHVSLVPTKWKPWRLGFFGR